MHWLKSFAAALVLLVAIDAHGHGYWPPKHGGERNIDNGEVAFELVSKGKDVLLYLEDHGQDIPADRIRGELSVRRGKSEWKAPLAYGGDNRLTAQLPVALRKGDELVAELKFRNGSRAEGRFVVGTNVDSTKMLEALLGKL
jgi:hypothetical protein